MRELPQGWRRVEFDELAGIRAGLVDPRQAAFADMLHVGPEHIDPHSGAITGELLTASQAGLISGKFLFRPGDIVYSKIRPNLNKIVRPNFEGLCSADMYVLVAHQRICDQSFLLHLLHGEQFYKQAVAASMRSGLPKVNRADLSLISVDLPPLAEQRAIASMLDDFNSAIVATEAIVAAKRRAKRALDQAWLSAACEEITPAGWSRIRLGQCFTERDERGGALPLLAITSGRGIVDRDSIERRDTSNDDKSAYKVIRAGDIGYNTMRMWQGVSGLSRLTGLISPAYTVVSPDADRIEPVFAAQLFKLPRMIHRFWRYSQGLVDDTLQLKFESFAEIEINLPPLDHQRTIAGVLAAATEELEILAAQAEALRRQKRGLMQKLLTGKWRVDDAEAQEAAE